MRARRPARGPGRRRRDHRSRRRSPAACCSATSPSSSTRATPPSPSAGPPRSRSTRGCSPSCSAAPSCASCSTPRCSPRSRPSCSGSPPTAGPATPRASPTCCGCSGRSRPTEVGRALASTAPTSRGWLAALADSRRRRRGPDGRRGALGRDRGRRPAPRRARRRPCRPAPPTRSPSRSTTRSADLVARYARTHGPFTTDDVAARLGLGAAVVRHTLQRLAAQGRVLDGEFRPAGVRAREWCDAEVLRRLRRRSWPGCARRSSRSSRTRSAGSSPPGSTSAGAARAASTACSRSSTSSPGCAGARLGPGAAGAGRPGARLRAALPRRADRLRRGLWAGHGALPGSDGWVSLHLADQAPLTLPEHEPVRAQRAPPGRPRRAGARRRVVLPPARRRGRLDRRQRRSAAALWDLVWAGRVSNDTLAPLRALTRGGTAAHRTPPAAAAATAADPAAGCPRAPARPRRAGRWALLPDARHRPDPARPRRRRAAARPARRGHPRRGGQRAAAGRVRRGLQGAVGVRGLRPLPARLLRRAASAPPSSAPPARSTGCAPSPRPPTPTPSPTAVALAATDPANPYGAALPWPDARRRRARGHRRAARPAPWSSWSTATSSSTSSAAAAPCSPGPTTPTLLAPAADVARRGRPRGALGRLTVEKADGEQLLGARLDARCARRSTPPASSRRPRGLRLACLRATPSSAPRGRSTAPWPASVLTAHRLPGARARHRRPRPAARRRDRLPRQAPAHPHRPPTQPWTLHTHLKMEGAWHVLPARPALARPGPPGPGRARDRPARSRSGFSLGIVELLAARRRRHDVVGHLGPDLLGPDWDEDEAAAPPRAPSPTAPIGEALLDQRNLAGIGNMYTAELCFVAGRRTRQTPVGDVARPAPAGPARPTRCSSSTRSGAVQIDDRRPARARADVGLPPRPVAVPPLRHPDRGRRCWARPGRERAAYWCPSCQP